MTYSTFMIIHVLRLCKDKRSLSRVYWQFSVTGMAIESLRKGDRSLHEFLVFSNKKDCNLTHQPLQLSTCDHSRTSCRTLLYQDLADQPGRLLEA